MICPTADKLYLFGILSSGPAANLKENKKASWWSFLSCFGVKRRLFKRTYARFVDVLEYDKWIEQRTQEFENVYRNNHVSLQASFWIMKSILLSNKWLF